jgi:serine/threonine protein kinase/WD40 repeat protein
MASSSKHASALGDDIRAQLRAAGLSAAEIVDLIANDLQTRWQQDQRVLVETYLADLPGRVDAELRMDLIYTEILAREAAGERPGPAEYAFRFPDLAERIHAQFLLHRALLDDAESNATAPAHAEPLTPPRFAHVVQGYDLLEELGQGGMGIVYKARHRELNRIVALKILRPDCWNRDPESRLRREAEALARLQHPSIVQIYEVGVADGQPYLALEYVSGGTLADRFRDGSMKVVEVAALIRLVALAVHAAHEQGLVHRDLKPANILMVGSADRSAPAALPTVKVTDFGLVKRLDQSDLSRTGELLGTPSYMAPEQAAGRKDIGPAVDVYALGAILYEGLSGRPPFQGDSAISVLTQVAGAEPIPPSRLRRHIAADLEAVVLKCLEKAPARRYASAAALAEDLRRFLDSEPTLARPLTALGRVSKFIRRHPLPAGLAALLAVSLLGGLAGIVWQWQQAVDARSHVESAWHAEAEQRRQAEQNLYHSRIAQAVLLWEKGRVTQARELHAACRPRANADDLRDWEWHYLDRLFHAELRTLRLPGAVNGLAVCPSLPDCPDELAVAIGKNPLLPSDPAGATASAVFLQPLAANAAVRAGPVLLRDAVAHVVSAGPLLASESTRSSALVAWATSGRELVLGDRRSGQRVQTVPLSEVAKALCFTRAGNVLVGGGFNSLRELNPRTGEQRAEHSVAIGFVDVLAAQPAGPLLAIGSTPSARLLIYEQPSYRLVQELTPHGSGLQALVFSPDGRHLAAAYRSGSISVWDANTWRELRRFQGLDGPVNALAFHPSGRLLASGGADHTVRLWDIVADRLVAVYRGHEAAVLSLAFAPGTAWLASGSQDRTIRLWDTTRNPHGQMLHRRVVKGGYAFDPPPPGLTVQTMNEQDKVQTNVLAADRPLVHTTFALRSQPGNPVPPSAMIAGGRLAQISSSDRCCLEIVDLDSKKPHNVLPGGTGAIQALASDPTGRWLVWAAAEGKDGVLLHRWDATRDVKTGPMALPVATVRSLAVASTGGWLIAVTGEPQGNEIKLWAIDGAGGAPPREIMPNALQVGGVAFRPDERELAVSLGDTIHQFRVGTWEVVRTISCSAANGLAYSPNGRRLAAVSADGVVTLSDPDAGKALFQLPSLGPPRVIDQVHHACVAFSPNGAWLVSTNWDGTFNVWDGSAIGLRNAAPGERR